MKRRWWQRVAVGAALVVGVAGGTRLATAGAAAQPQVREITVVAERFKFTPDRVEVNQGDTVRLIVKSADGTHGFAIKKMRVESTVPKGGQPVTVEFVADKPGSFPISCSGPAAAGTRR